MTHSPDVARLIEEIAQTRNELATVFANTAGLVQAYDSHARTWVEGGAGIGRTIAETSVKDAGSVGDAVEGVATGAAVAVAGAAIGLAISAVANVYAGWKRDRALAEIRAKRVQLAEHKIAIVRKTAAFLGSAKNRLFRAFASEAEDKLTSTDLEREQARLSQLEEISSSFIEASQGLAMTTFAEETMAQWLLEQEAISEPPNLPMVRIDALRSLSNASAVSRTWPSFEALQSFTMGAACVANLAGPEVETVSAGLAKLLRAAAWEATLAALLPGTTFRARARIAVQAFLERSPYLRLRRRSIRIRTAAATVATLVAILLATKGPSLWQQSTVFAEKARPPAPSFSDIPPGPPWYEVLGEAQRQERFDMGLEALATGYDKSTDTGGKLITAAEHFAAASIMDDEIGRRAKQAAAKIPDRARRTRVRLAAQLSREVTGVRATPSGPNGTTLRLGASSCDTEGISDAVQRVKPTAREAGFEAVECCGGKGTCLAMESW